MLVGVQPWCVALWHGHRHYKSHIHKLANMETRKVLKTWDSEDLRVLLEHALVNNAKMRALVGADEELTETERMLFRLASGIGQDTASSRRGPWPKSNATPDSQDRPGQVQPLVRSLMKTVLEDYPTLLTDADIRDLMSREYCKSTLGITIANHPLLNRMEQGSNDHNGHGRYYVDPYAGKFYVCSQWWKDYHLTNAKSLLRFVIELIERKHDHPGVPALKRHRQAFLDYIGRPRPDGN